MCYNINGDRVKKVKNIIIIFLPIMIIATWFIIHSEFKVILKSNVIGVNEKYTCEYIAYYKDSDVTDKVTLTSNVDNTKIGIYKVIFKYKNHKRVLKIKVVDVVAPTIVLKGGESVNTPLGSNYIDLGYNVTDNYDSDIDVKVTGNVDTAKEGTYELTYTAYDSSGNMAMLKRTVNVSGVLPDNMSVSDFSLNGYFQNTILKETDDAGQEYINKIIFAGDSVPLYYVMSGHIKGSQLWHKEGLNAEAALVQPIYIAHQSTDLTFVDAFRKYQPEIVIMDLGMNSAGVMDVNYFIDCYKKLINQIKEVSPNTKLIIQSIPPVDASLDEKEEGLTNKKINIFNYHIVEMCNELNIPFLNSAEVLKNTSGTCQNGYCYLEKNNYGIHQTKEGNDAVFRYIRTHKYEY